MCVKIKKAYLSRETKKSGNEDTSKAQVKDLTQLTPADLGREVKDEEDWWEDLKEETPGVVKRLLEGAMEKEMREQLRAGRYRRSLLGRGSPNGYKQRHLLTELGLVARQWRGGRPGTGKASSTPPLYPITSGVRRR